MTFVGGMTLGQPSTGLRFATTRGRIQGGAGAGLNYPSPFFDVAHTYLPTTIKQLLRWCRYYFMTHPLINATTYKLSEYPVTDIVIDDEDEGVRTQWLEYLQETLRYRSFQIEVNLDYNVYGICLVGISFPFQKYLRCSSCGWQEQARKVRDRWTFTNYEFRLNCPKCGHVGPSSVRDFYIKDASAVRLIRWNPEDIEISYNEFTGQFSHFYNIPGPLRGDISIGKKDVVEQVPQVFIQAIKRQQGVVLQKDLLFQMRRPSISSHDRGWGMPLLLPVLKDAFYMQIMRKAQECVAPTTLLVTRDGLVAAKDVRVGDLVRTHLGQFKPVVQKQVRPMLEERGDYAVELAITGLRQLPSTFSDNHPMWVLRRNEDNRRSDSKEHRRSSYVLRNTSLYDFEWVDAGDVSEGDYVGYPTSRRRDVSCVDVAKYVPEMVSTCEYVYSGVRLETAHIFERLEAGDASVDKKEARGIRRYRTNGTQPNRMRRQLDLDVDLAYLAGWYLGDGSCGARHVDFSMGPKDDGAELQATLERLFDVQCSSYPCAKSRGWVLCVSNTLLAAFMKGWIPGDAKHKRIPEEIMNASDEVVLSFLRGYLEADGYTALSVRNDERVSVCCANGQLMYQLWELLLSLGCISTIAERVAYTADIRKLDGSVQRVEGGRPVFQWSVSASSARRLGQLMRGEPADIVTSGKSGFFIHGYFAARILSTKIVPCPQVISFEVEEDHTFCVPGMATHNSILLEHVLPLRVLFPQAGSGSSDPYTHVHLDTWKEHVAQEIARWRYDCVTPDTWVVAREGLVRAQDVHEGMELRNHTGSFSVVEKMWRRPLRIGERAYRVDARGLSSVHSVFSEGHPLLVARKFNNGNGHKLGDAIFVRVKDVCAGDYVGEPVVRQVKEATKLDLADYVDRACTADWVYVDYEDPSVPCVFEHLQTGADLEDRQHVVAAYGCSINQYKTAQIAIRENRTLRRVGRYLEFDVELAWVVGMYLAEGSASGKQVMFALHKNETAIQDRLSKFFSERFGANVMVANRSEHGVQVYYSSKVAAEFFAGFCPGVAKTKRIPDVFMTASNSVVLSLLRGMVEGDGCFHEDGKSDKLTYVSTSLDLAEGFRWLTLTLGVPAGIQSWNASTYEIEGRHGKVSTSYTVSVYGEARDRLISLFSGGAAQEVPSCRMGVYRDGYFWHRIRKIDQVEAEEVIGFQMDRAVQVCLPDDTEAHGTFCTWGMAGANSAYIPILPLPIGQQTIGGDGRALLLTQELQVAAEQLLNGMMTPREFLMGGLSYSGSNVSLRMLENMFLGNISDHKQLLKFVMRRVGDYLEWPVPRGRFKPFKMADDLQRLSLLFQANAANKISDTTFLGQLDLSQEEENKIKLRETVMQLESTEKQQLAMAEIQGKAQMVMMKYQTKAQVASQQDMQQPQAPGEPGGPDNLEQGTAGGQGMAAVGEHAPEGVQPPYGGVPQQAQSQVTQTQGPGMDMQSWAMAQAQMISRMPAEQRAMALSNLEQQNAELASLVRVYLSQLVPQQGSSESTDMRPLPEKLPARRDAQIL